MVQVRGIAILAFCLLSCLVGAGTAQAGPVLDAGFGQKGRITENISMNEVRRGGSIQAIEALPGGDFMVAVRPDPGKDWLSVARFRPDGSLDRTYAGDGILEPGFGYLVEFLDNGKVLIGGDVGAGTPGRDVAVRRYKADGSLDRSFAKNGLFRKDLGAEDGTTGMSISSKGRILLVANVFCHATQRVCYDSTSDTNELLTVSPEGKLLNKKSLGSDRLGDIVPTGDGGFRAIRSGDPNYSDDSHDFIAIGPSLEVDVIREMGDQPDWEGPVSILPGNGLYAFARPVASESRIVKVRPDGTIDQNFGAGGTSTCAPEGFGADFGSRQIRSDHDGRILAGGSSGCSLFRVRPDGTLDPSFGTGGIGALPVDSGGYSLGWKVAVTGDDHILISRWDYDSGRLVVRRLKENGDPDEAFGQKSVPILQPSSDVARTVIPFGAGVLVGGSSNCYGYAPYSFQCIRFALGRYDRNGKPVSTFGTNGKVTGDFMTVNSLARDRDGKLIAAGSRGATSSHANSIKPGFALARFNPDGSLDEGFGDGGVTYTDFLGEVGSAEIRSVAVQPDGKILVTGEAMKPRGGESIFLPVARYDADGTLDDSFGSGGILRVSLHGLELGTAIKALPSGRILVAGRDYFDAMVLRLKADGSLDRTFGKAGVARPKFEARPRFGEKVHYTPARWATSMTVLKDGSILASASDGYGSQAGVVFKLHRNGKVDRGFGKKGVAYTGGLSADALIVDRCGRITMAGTYQKLARTRRRFGIARLKGDGGVDRGFNRGRTKFPFTGALPSWANAATVAGRRIIAVGAIGRTITNEDFALAAVKVQKECK